ncbi:hypothetical protein [Acinetobacter soli]|uniref:hypothetical protein n=1 Tax=Acinetobacter soli TaxID=487316 RepID=UPI003AA80F4C
MTRRNVLVLLWVLLPALLTVGILSIAGNPSDGIRLGLLSLPVSMADLSCDVTRSVGLESGSIILKLPLI